MRKSKSEAAATRERIIATASKLILEKGLATVGMRELMQAAGLSPGGFYRHFASRDDLIAEAIRSAFDSLVAILELEIADKIPAKQLERIISIYLGQSKKTNQAAAPYLCPLAQLGAEMKHSAPVIQAAGFEGYGRLTKLIATCLPPSKAEEKAKLMVNTLVGAVTLASLAPDEKTAVEILTQAKVSAYSFGDLREAAKGIPDT